MVNQECNYVNHFDLETKSTPTSKKWIQPYQIGLGFSRFLPRVHQSRHRIQVDSVTPDDFG
jgi:hypothetical protein